MWVETVFPPFKAHVMPWYAQSPQWKMNGRGAKMVITTDGRDLLAVGATEALESTNAAVKASG